MAQARRSSPAPGQPGGSSTTVAVVAPKEDDEMPDIKLGTVDKYSGEETGLKARQFFHYIIKDSDYLALYPGLYLLFCVVKPANTASIP